MSSDVVAVNTDHGMEGQNSLQGVENNDSSTQTNVQPEFVNIKEELECEDADEPDAEATEPPLDTQMCPSDLVQTELLEPHQFHVTIKQEHIDQEFSDAESSGDYELKSEPAEIVDAAPLPTSMFYISEEEIPTILANSFQNECPICQKKLVNRSNLQRHLIFHTRFKVECNMCHRQYINNNQLGKHMRNAHSVKKAFECPDCKKTFRSSSNLLQHKRSHLSQKPHVCDVCNRGFAVKSNMLRHKSKSRCKQPAGPLICDVCDKEFEREFLLRSHMRMHTTETPFQCENCEMSFKYKSTLVRHMQLHKKDRPYSCNICGKTFTHSGLIKPHMRKHTGEKPFACPICQKRFSHKHNMTRHSLRHNKVKHLVCEVCHKKFSKESRLKYHMRTHLVDKRPFKCEHCHKAYSHRQNIQRHYKKKHPSVVYDRPETDASMAKIIWQGVMKKKLAMEKEYIIPETDWPVEENGSKVKEE